CRLCEGKTWNNLVGSGHCGEVVVCVRLLDEGVWREDCRREDYNLAGYLRMRVLLYKAGETPHSASFRVAAWKE
ncbi:MAG: hypothetical protein KDD67_10890, partial [Ignavibacteriae bacterium]|nr:hypothetical protein [Ignavibacteriota bacterium]